MDSHIYELDPLDLPSSSQFAAIRKRYIDKRSVNFKPENNIDRLILSPEDCGDILRSGFTHQHLFKIAYKVNDNELCVIPDQTPEESRKATPDEGEKTSNVSIPPAPKLIWQVCEYRSDRDIYNLPKKNKQLRIDRSNIQISANELQVWISKKVDNCSEQNGVGKINSLRSTLPKKLLALINIYLNRWQKAIESFPDRNSFDHIYPKGSGTRKKFISDIETQIRGELKKYNNGSLFRTESIISGCLDLLRPDIFRNSQQVKMTNIYSENVQGPFNYTLNVLIKISEASTLSENSPEKTPKNSELIKQLDGYGFSQKLAGHGATVLRPMTAPRGRPKKIVDK